jgi:hypothetical protein
MVDAKSSMEISELRSRIEAKSGFPVERQMLVSNGLSLNKGTVDDYGIFSGSTIFCSIRGGSEHPAGRNQFRVNFDCAPAAQLSHIFRSAHVSRLGRDLSSTAGWKSTLL